MRGIPSTPPSILHLSHTGAQKQPASHLAVKQRELLLLYVWLPESCSFCSHCLYVTHKHVLTDKLYNAILSPWESALSLKRKCNLCNQFTPLQSAMWIGKLGDSGCLSVVPKEGRQSWGLHWKGGVALSGQSSTAPARPCLRADSLHLLGNQLLLLQSWTSITPVS